MSVLENQGVRVRGLTRTFGTNTILRNLDLDIRPGEFVALLGHSGSGKTTLLRTLARLDAAEPGTVTLPSAPAVVFQEPRLLPWKRVIDNVVLGAGVPNAQTRAIAALREVGLEHRTQAWPLTLSGGEAQRAALARALVREPALLLLDEPFAALDALTRMRMHRLVLDLWQRHGPAVLLVTHDVDEALVLADRVFVLEAGRIAFERTIPAARPRDRASEAFVRLRGEVLAALGVEDDARETPAERCRPTVSA